MRKLDKVLIFSFFIAALLLLSSVINVELTAKAVNSVRQTLTTSIDIPEATEGFPTMCDFGGCPVETTTSAPTAEAPSITAVQDVSEQELIFEETYTETEDVYVIEEPAEVYEENYISEEQQNGSYLGLFKCTAYCGCYECSEGYGNMTATGVTAQANHTIAVDPSVIPYGTWVIINGQAYRAEDCGGGVNGNHIDIYFDSHSAAEAFGLQYCDVYLA